MKKITEFLKNSIIASWLISGIFGGLAGYWSDHFKHIDSAKTDQALKTLSDFDDLNDAIVAYGIALAQQHDVPKQTDGLRLSISRQLTRADDLKLVFTDNDMKTAVTAYERALLKMSARLDVMKTSQDITDWEADVDLVAETRKALKRKVLSIVGI